MAEQNGNFEQISGTVEKITFQNVNNGYTVAEVKVKNEIITVVGILPFLNEGDTADFFGSFTVHQIYGSQFSANTYERKMPETVAAILRYLSSGAIKGIGPATAIKIVERFGEESLNIISENPIELTVISGISKQKALTICEEYKKQFGVRDILMLLYKYKITPDKCYAIYKHFPKNPIGLIRDNPYILCEDGIDFSFELVEEIAEDFGFDKDNEARICAGIEYVLRKNLHNGHTCLPRKKLVEVASKLLDTSETTVDICCDRLTECFRISKGLIEGIEFLSLPEYLSAEQQIASRLLNIKRFINPNVTADELEIQMVENSLGIKFESLQREAIFEAFKSGVLVLTGGPGTGKTTTLNAIIKLFENRNLVIELAAPTGRAAKRMTELTGKKAKTIHRLLQVEWGRDDKREFARNEKNPLECDVIIIDEASMIDSLLFNDLLKALRQSCRIILVGDYNQLPSISAGNVLSDILSANIFPSITLKKVFRQAANSKIIANAHAIINNEPADFSCKTSDCFFIRQENSVSAHDTVLELVTKRLPNAYNINPMQDIQLICPSRIGEVGTVNLNNSLQEILNPVKKGEPQVNFKGFSLRNGDRVMQIKNNYDLQYQKDDGGFGTGVFNGDVGYVTDVDIRNNIIRVRFDDKVATYFSEDFSQLELAYAVTVHKSQGSEYDYVILPLYDTPLKLRYRNLIYTAVTRAKKLLIIVGSQKIWSDMVANDRKTLRYTWLESLLKEKSKELF